MAEILEFQVPKSTVPINPKDLIGKMLMLNEAIAPRFQCGGFSVNSRRPIDLVTERTQLLAIAAALKSGLLIDVSDNKIADRGFELKNSSASKILSEDTDKKAFIGKDPYGRMFVIVPKDEEERLKFETQLAEKGNLDFTIEDSEEFTGFSPIIEEELKTDVKS